jgi:SHS family lactate transporter-like MFS transporter
MLSLLWFAVFDAAIYFAPTFAWVLVLRTLFGFGMGAEWTAGTSLAMESFPARGRKFASGMLQAGWPIGFFLSAAIGYFVVPAFGWRAMFLIAAIPALAVIPIRMFVPDELSRVAKHEGSARPDLAGDQRYRGAFADLFATRGVPTMIALGSMVMALGFIVYYGMTTSYGGVHAEIGLSAATAKLDMMWFNVGMLIGVVAAGWVANRFGVIIALVTPALLMVPALPLYIGVAPGLMPLGAFLGGLLGVGYSGVTPVLTTSLFPDHVRARAIGIVYHVGALIAAFVPSFIPWIVKTTGMTLSLTVAVVVGSGLVAMATAILALRGYITAPLHLRAPGPLAVRDSAIPVPIVERIAS